MSLGWFTKYHGFKNRTGPPTGHHSGSVRSLDRMETEPGLDRLNRRSNW